MPELNKKLLEVLACPQCKGDLNYKKPQQKLVCPKCKLAYRIEDNIPIMLIEEAEKIKWLARALFYKLQKQGIWCQGPASEFRVELRGHEKFVFLGGLDRNLKEAIARELGSKGIAVRRGDGRFEGSNPDNICNRGVTGKGVQLEITRGLRDDMAKRELISDAVRNVLTKI